MKIQYKKQHGEEYFYDFEIEKNHFSHKFYFDAMQEFASNKLENYIINNVLFADTFIWKEHERKVLNEVREKYVIKFAKIMKKYIFEMYLKTYGL